MKPRLTSQFAIRQIATQFGHTWHRGHKVQAPLRPQPQTLNLKPYRSQHMGLSTQVSGAQRQRPTRGELQTTASLPLIFLLQVL